MKYVAALVLFIFIQNEKVLFVGDSLTAYQNGWQAQLSKEKNYQSTNIAVSGKRTDWMIDVLCDNLKTQHYDKIFIYCGINDLVTNYKAEIPLNNIRTMILICKKHNIEPIIVTGYNPLIIRVGKNKNFETTVKYEYKRLQDSLLTITNVKIIEPAPLIKTDTNDGIHLNSAGQKKFSEWIINHM